MNVPIRRRSGSAPEPAGAERRPAPDDRSPLWPTGLLEPFDSALRTALARVDDAVRDVVPLVDLEERDDSYLLDVELPGVRRDDVSVELTAGQLVITAERRERERVGLLRHRTRTTGRYRLELTLPVDVDGDHVAASLEQGVLTVVVPKAEHARRRRIPVARRGAQRS